MDRIFARLLLAAVLLLASSCPVEVAPDPAPEAPHGGPLASRR